MKTLLLVFGLYCQYILTAHLENHQNDFNDDKTNFETLSDGPVYEIVNHLDDKDKISFSKTSRYYLKYDPREVQLRLPLRNSKEPSLFLCDELKKRKKLFISINYKYISKSLFDSESVEMKYLKCLSGIEKLSLWHLEISKIFSNPIFKVQELFPNLQHLLLDFDAEIPLDAIPNTLKILELHFETKKEDLQLKKALKEKIVQMKKLQTLELYITDYSEGNSFPFEPMISELVNLPNFTRLKLKSYRGYNYFQKILAKIQHAQYFVDLEDNLKGNLFILDFIEKLPKKTETLKLNLLDFDENEKLCTVLKKMSHLKSLRLSPDSKRKAYYCLLYSLPPSLTELKYERHFETEIETDKINLPKSLKSAQLGRIHSNVFNAFASQVQFLQATIIDPDSFMTIEKPFTKVETLVYEDDSKTFSLDFWLHFLKLLPMHMESVTLDIRLPAFNDPDVLEKKILSFGKRIKQFKLIVRYLKNRYSFSGAQYIKGTYVFDGTKMIKQD